MCGFVPQQVLRIDLVFLKHNKYGRVCDIVDTAIVEVNVSAIFGRRPNIAGFPFCVTPHQNTSDKHGFDIRVARVAVGVLGVPSKVASFAISCSINPTDPPIKVVETNGINVFRVGAMKKLLFFHFASIVVVLHLILLPLKDFPKCFVLNPLYLDNIEASQGCTKKCFQLLKFI